MQMRALGMFSLRSDFIRHSFINLVGGSVTLHDQFIPLELYFVLIQNPQLFCGRAQYILTVRLRRIPSKFDDARLNPPMSLKLSPMLSFEREILLWNMNRGQMACFFLSQTI
jgi:hypothetical protein